MATTTTSASTAAADTAYLAQEYLVKTVGVEASQRANLVDTVWVQTLMDLSSLTAHFRFRNPVGAPSSTSENSTLPTLAWSPTGVTISAGLEGGSIPYSKLHDKLTPEVLDEIAEALSKSLSRSLDSAIAAMYPSLTGGTIGTSGTALTVTQVMAGVSTLDANHADEVGQYYGVLTPRQFYQLANDVKNSSFGIGQINQNVKDGSRTTIEIEGVTFRKNSLLTTINSGADAAGAMYVDQSIGLVVAEAPMVEVLPVPTKHQWSIDGTLAFGVGVVRPTLGILIQSGVSV